MDILTRGLSVLAHRAHINIINSTLKTGGCHINTLSFKVVIVSSSRRTIPQQAETQLSQTAPQEKQEHMCPGQQQNENWSYNPQTPPTTTAA